MTSPWTGETTPKDNGGIQSHTKWKWWYVTCKYNVIFKYNVLIQIKLSNYMYIKEDFIDIS